MARSTRDAGNLTDRRPQEWTLVETLGANEKRVVAEGDHPRAFTNIKRSLTASNAAVARILPVMVDATTASRDHEEMLVSSASGGAVRVIAEPIVSANEVVVGVHVWAGSESESPPMRPLVGSAVWDCAVTGMSRTSADLEEIFGHKRGWAQRAFPEFLAQFESFDDRVGFLALFQAADDGEAWESTAVVARSQRHVHLAARPSFRDGRRTVQCLVHDVTSSQPSPPTVIGARLWRSLPIKPGHSVGIIDLSTGLVHEWIALSTRGLTAWMRRIPEIHPHDVTAVAAARARLLDDADQASVRFRLRLNGSAWVSVVSQWTILCRGRTPQALLTVHL